MTALSIFDAILFVIFAVNIVYLAVFSVASLLKTKVISVNDVRNRKIAILIPAYREDAVIVECVDSCLNQNYPPEMYDTVVISDRMSDKTNECLKEMPIILINVYFENSTKSKALNYAMAQLEESYDIVLILDADNTISPNFLTEIDSAFANPDMHILQAHRCAKNTNTPLAMLDAVSEEINNSIFRKGHVNMGLSAALIGSGMCFDYMLFKKTMLSIDAVGGFDRALELVLLRDGHRIYYLPKSDVLDEKVQRKDDFARQRRRWLSAQLHYFTTTVKYVPLAILEGKWDFCDKMFQQMSIPRVMLMGFTTIIAIVVTVIDAEFAIKWWILFTLLIISLLIAIPRKLFSRALIKAIIQIPNLFIVMVINIFRLKGVNKRFIHTQHGVKEKH